MKGSNKEGQPTAESLEGRPETKENDRQRHMRPTQCGKRMSQGLKGVRLGRLLALTPFIQGKSRMWEIRPYGSVRGVPGDRHPYRDWRGIISFVFFGLDLLDGFVRYFSFAALRFAPANASCAQKTPYFQGLPQPTSMSRTQIVFHRDS